MPDIALKDGTRVRIRRLQPGDSVAELTAMLHDAFARLRRLGLNCGCVSQTEATTRARLAQGDAFVAVREAQWVGTVTLCHTDASSSIARYRQPGAASLHQLGVAPALQACGIGAALLALGERWAAAHGYRELALDTPKPASHLLSYYARHGFHCAEVLRQPGRNYVSAVLCKPLGSKTAPAQPTSARPAARRAAAALPARWATPFAASTTF